MAKKSFAKNFLKGTSKKQRIIGILVILLLVWAFIGYSAGAFDGIISGSSIKCSVTVSNIALFDSKISSMTCMEERKACIKPFSLFSDILYNVGISSAKDQVTLRMSDNNVFVDSETLLVGEAIPFILPESGKESVKLESDCVEKGNHKMIVELYDEQARLLEQQAREVFIQ